MLSRLRRLSIREIRVRALQQLLAQTERAALALGLNDSHARGVSPEWLAPPMRGHSRLRSEMRLALALDHEAAESAKALADGIAHGRIPVLGVGPVLLGNPPDWHLDAISKKRTPLRHWSQIDYLDSRANGDHKVIWEANRHQYLVQLALARLSATDETPLVHLREHLHSWLRGNPFRMGVNWASSLEVAFRAISWSWLIRLIGPDELGADLTKELALGIVRHARHIQRYLSTYFSPNTHLTGEALGLFTAGVVVENHREAARWRQLGSEILEDAIGWHVRADGTYFEQATQYHRYTAEIYLQYLLIGESAGWEVGPHVRPALSKLFDVLRSLADARGRIPLIGDDDGGALLPLDSRPPDDVRSLLLAGAVALDRPELAFPGASPLMATALCGYTATMRMVERTVDPAWRDRAFVDGGFYVLRDGWHPTAAVAVVNAGVHGAMNCGHAHADALAMTLTLGEQALFVDRGTFTYTGPERNEFRSTCSHNTVEIDGESSAEPGTAFAWRSIPPVPEAKAGASRELRWVSAVSRGHFGSPRPSVHRRVIMAWRGGPWVVFDRVSRPGLREARARWYLAPDVTPVMERAGVVDVVTDSTVRALASIAFPCALTVELENRDVSFRLGGRTPSKVLAAGADASGRVVTLVAGPATTWASDHPAAHPEATWGCASGGWRHTVIVRPEGLPTWSPFGVHSDAELAWCIEPQAADARGSARLCLVVPQVATAPGGPHEVRDSVAFGVTVLERVAGGWRALPNEEFGQSATE